MKNRIYFINDASSMTARLKKMVGKDFYIKLHSQLPGKIEEEEAKLLNLEKDKEQVIRIVELGKKSQALIIARSILPSYLFEGDTAHCFNALGETPLGEILFQDPNLKRSPFEISKIDTRDHAWIQIFSLKEKKLWARRSIFYFKGKALLVFEVFLSAIKGACNEAERSYRN